MALFVSTHDSSIRAVAAEQARLAYPNHKPDLDVFKHHCANHAASINAALKAPSLPNADIDICLRKLSTIQKLADKQFGTSGGAVASLFLNLSPMTERRLLMRKEANKHAAFGPATPEQQKLQGSIRSLPTRLDALQTLDAESLITLHRLVRALDKEFDIQSETWRRQHTVLRFEILSDAASKIANALGKVAITAHRNAGAERHDVLTMRTPAQAEQYAEGYRMRVARAVEATCNLGGDIRHTLDSFMVEAVEMLAVFDTRATHMLRQDTSDNNWIRSLNPWQTAAYQLQCNLGDVLAIRVDLAGFAPLGLPPMPYPEPAAELRSAQSSTTAATTRSSASADASSRANSPERVTPSRHPFPADLLHEARELRAIAEQAVTNADNRIGPNTRPARDMARIERRLRAENIPLPRLTRRASDDSMHFQADRRFVHDWPLQAATFG